MDPHELVMMPTVQNAIGIQAWGEFAGKSDLGALIGELRGALEKVQAGNLKSVEAMLYGQAMALQTIFTNLARRATNQQYLKHTQTYLGLALKAQAQCRSTLETLAEIKNPRPVAFVKQANISGGAQQVNNGVGAAVSAETRTVRAGAHPHAHAGENTNLQNGLLEHQHGQFLDTRTQSMAGGADPHMEAVAAGLRPAQP